MTGHQIVEIAAQCGKPALCRGDGGLDVRHLSIFECRQQLLYGIGKFSDSVEADDGQGAMRLVHAGTGLLQFAAGRTGRVCSKTHPGTLQCQVDFPFDPGQWAGIDIRTHEKLFTTPWPIVFCCFSCGL